ncbi:MAG: DUF4957 domain-containing protein [Niabella sp.]|nr:DUF4957 domain-containing protein [Niabella sp.]
MKRYSGNAFFLVMLTGIVAMVSCKKNDNILAPMRQFMPSGTISVTTSATYAILKWGVAINADSNHTKYTVILSQDSSFTNGPQLTYTTDSARIWLYDTALGVRKTYYARVKTNGAAADLDSKWVNSKGFKITGEQLFLPIRETELKATEITLRWTPSPGATKITLTTTAGSKDYTLTAGEISSGIKVISGLTPSTKYDAELFAGTVSKGFLSFATPVLEVITISLSPGADLVAVLDTCANGSVIGLAPGTYGAGIAANYVVKNKTVSIKSTSGNPADTKVYFKEFDLKGTGAGISLNGIEFQGVSTTAALYFLNLIGLNSDGEAATFTNINLFNCTIHDYGNCLLRANRATATGGHVIGTIKFRNCIAYNNALANLYTEFTLDKLAFTKLDISNSTFYNVGQAFVSCATAMSLSPVPVIAVDGCTFNNFGANAKYLLLDANTNPVTASFTNSIFANSPRSGSVNAIILRSSGAGASTTFTNNNYFKLQNGTNANLTFPSGITMNTNWTLDLGWSATTTDFTLPQGSVLRSGSSTGGAIGDPRWAY